MLRYLIIAFLLASCGSMPDGVGGRTLFLGDGSSRDAFRVPTETDLISWQTEIIGAWLDLDENDQFVGAGIGYRARDVVVAPFECKVVFIIDGEEALRQAVSLTEEFIEGREEICITED